MQLLNIPNTTDGTLSDICGFLQGVFCKSLSKIEFWVLIAKNLDKRAFLPYYLGCFYEIKETIMDQVKPKISVDYTENAVVATLTDEKILEQADIEALEASIMPLVEQGGGMNLVISFADVKFLTSAVLGLLIRVSKKVYESDGQLKLCSIEPKILEIFKITRLDKVFDIYEDREQALQAVT